MFLPYVSFIIAFTALDCIKRYWETVCIAGQIYPLTPSYGSNWGHQIGNFVILPDISFIIAFMTVKSVKGYWETICGESIRPVKFPPTPL